MQKHRKFHIRECDFGLGVFAREPIAENELILRFGGHVLAHHELHRQTTPSINALQIGPFLYVDLQPPGVFVNHSCSPNAGLRRNLYLHALRPIAPGEQIFYDYSTTMSEQLETMSCRCGAPRCRQTVTDFHLLPADVQQDYLARRVVQDFIVAEKGIPVRQYAQD